MITGLLLTGGSTLLGFIGDFNVTLSDVRAAIIRDFDQSSFPADLPTGRIDTEQGLRRAGCARCPGIARREIKLVACGLNGVAAFKSATRKHRSNFETTRQFHREKWTSSPLLLGF